MAALDRLNFSADYHRIFRWLGGLILAKEGDSVSDKLQISLTLNDQALREQMAQVAEGMAVLGEKCADGVHDGLRRMAQAMAIAQIPELANIRQMTAANERAVANLCVLAQCDVAAVERVVSMAYPRATNDELLAALMVSGALAEFAESVREFGHRVEYVKRRYERNGKFDEVTA